MYKQIIDRFTGEVDDQMIQRLSDMAFIPFDPANADYQEYLEWLDEDNTPEEAE